MTDLRALAEAAAKPDRLWFGQGGRPKPLGVTWEESAFIAAASPAVVLALLDCIAAADEAMGWQVRSSSTWPHEQAYLDARDRLAEVLNGR